MLHARVLAVDTVALYFGERIDPEISRELLAGYRRMKEARIPGIVDLIPSYASLAIRFDPLRYEAEEVLSLARGYFGKAEGREEEARVVEIPVWYDPVAGPDLERIARERELEISRIVELHSGREYRVYALGFMPGFAYMGEVDPRLRVGRLATPRAAVPRGSVAIANAQCAVYPMESPGGWNLLGRTPLELFDPGIEGFSLLRPGDRVRFVPIDRAEYLRLGGVL